MFSPRPLRTVLGAGVAVLALTLVACGGDDDADSDTTESTGTEVVSTDAADPTTTASAAPASTTADGAATTVAGDPATTTGAPADRDGYVEAGMASMGTAIGDAGECVVESVVDGLGVDLLNDAGLTPQTFWNPTGAGAPLEAAGLTADSDEIRGVAESIADCDGLMESFAAASGETVTDDQLSCMEDGGAADLVGEVLALSLIGADTAELDARGEALGDDCGLGD